MNAIPSEPDWESGLPVIPETIVVHLGMPNQEAENLRVPFVDYIKNVASSEIYPTWPMSAIHANVLAQISYALNRVYTEYYRSQGYDFDITSTTQFDQKFIKDRDIFGNIAQIVDEIFNDYIVRRGTVQPLFAQYCNGTTSTCPGLSQWGTVELAKQGMIPYEILQHYYGDDIDIRFNVPVAGIEESYAGVPLRLGSGGEDVRLIQVQLNRIGDNYPSIPKLETDGVYGKETEAAVKRFQEIFNLTADGIVGKETWYKIKFIFIGIKGLSELESEGLTPEEVAEVIPRTLEAGDEGREVRIVQYLLAVIGRFNAAIPVVREDGIYDDDMVRAVKAFQQAYGLPATGIADRDTWNALNNAYGDILAAVPPATPEGSELFPGRFLSLNITGEDVRTFQRLLQRAAQFHSFIPPVQVTGVFDKATEDAVRAVQKEAGIEGYDTVGPLTWARVVELGKNASA